ncbi:MAG: hypothetical protein ACNI27_11585 [Desulfovibrio sp.]
MIKNTIYSMCIAMSLLIFTGCGHVKLSATSPPDIYVDAQVQKSELVIAIKPQHRTLYPLKTLFYPLVITQDLPDRIVVGRELGRIVHSTWAQQNVFPTLSYDDSLAYRTPQQAIQQGRAVGADIVICAFMPYLYSGSTLDDTAMTLHIKIYDTARGMLIWDMMQSGRINETMPNDMIYFKAHTRIPDSPSYAILSTLASDMAIPLKQWQAGAKSNGPLPTEPANQYKSKGFQRAPQPQQ